MEKLHFFDDDEYEDFCIDTTVIGSGSESEVLSYKNEYVLKILFPSAKKFFLRKKLRKLALLKHLRDYMTLPLSEVYLSFHFIGYMMEYAGLSWKDYILSNSLSFAEKVAMLRKGRIALEIIHQAGIVHGDIQFCNMMINNDKVKVTDINNVKYKGYRDVYLNEIEMFLSNTYGLTYLIDLHAYNYMTYILLNADETDLMDNLSLGAHAFLSFDPEKIVNRHFDDEEVKIQLDLLLNPKSKKIGLEKSKYLIDYIK